MTPEHLEEIRRRLEQGCSRDQLQADAWELLAAIDLMTANYAAARQIWLNSMEAVEAKLKEAQK